jgi:hypothetical protein
MTDKEILAQLIDKPDFFIETTLSVIDKSTNKVIPFKLNKIQKYFSQNYSKFNIVLKSRKGGISTYKIARALWKCLFKSNQRCVLLCQNDDATKEMFLKRVIPILTSCVVKIPHHINKADGYIEFPATNSTFRVGTAGSLTFGRGSDVTDFHLSEFSFYKSIDILTAIEEACMEDAEGTIETTANGINFFYHLWQRAELGQSKYKPIFIPWFFDETYRVKGITNLPDLTKEEKELIEKYNLDFEQLAWRRAKIQDMSNPELFEQEYPSSSVTAFISSGKLFFDWIILSKHEEITTPPKLIGFLKDNGDEKGVYFVPKSGSGLKIWGTPDIKHIYIIGSDIAEGLKDGAYSTAFVLDVNTMSQVAEYHGHIQPDDFAEILVNLARYYNNALLAPEAWPGPGQVTIDNIIKTGYSNIYIREKGPHSQKKQEQLYGWETNRRTKRDMFYNLNSMLKNYEITIKSKDLIYEMRSIVLNDDVIDVQEGCFSDRVIACAIACYLVKQFGYDPNNTKKAYLKIFNAVNKSENISYPNYKSKPYGVV